MGCGQMSVRREAANRVTINCWYQRRCGAVGVHLRKRVRIQEEEGRGRVRIQVHLYKRTCHPPQVGGWFLLLILRVCFHYQVAFGIETGRENRQRRNLTCPLQGELRVSDNWTLVDVVNMPLDELELASLRGKVQRPLARATRRLCRAR